MLIVGDSDDSKWIEKLCMTRLDSQAFAATNYNRELKESDAKLTLETHPIYHLKNKNEKWKWKQKMCFQTLTDNMLKAEDFIER